MGLTIILPIKICQFIAHFGAGGVGGRKFQVGGILTMDRLSFYGNLEMAINFRAVLDAVNADKLFCGIDPVKNAIVEPLDFAFHARADGGVQTGELRVGLAAYFDLVAHGWWRGFQGLNLSARSSCRAARSSPMIPGCCAVSQS